MTDATLEDFSAGDGIDRDKLAPEPDHDEKDDTPHRHESYHNGRCRAISQDGQRCRADSQMSSELCGPHDRADDVTTIDDGPRELIEATSGVEWENFANRLVRGAVKDRDWEIEFGEGGGPV